ncbi:MAG: Transamidase GatB domain protein [uncultured Campylobacterales bacterium]|uniref:Transamidase GatB domain protein n=1 Tax=uncultured Campylobacterales bacterium TaxID=352960 RepID=A0A6S6SRK1_9BACT|nr:MAG: Transamidase GatB domain protein [uncultured Campylobacterales bacterium]
MSEIKAKIKSDIKQAMINKETLKRDTIRSINTAIKQVEVDTRTELEDEDIIKLIQKLVKQRKEAATQYKEANRPELEVKELSEASILENYLPAQLSDDELRNILKDIVASTNATSMKDMGKVMKEANVKTAGQADGARISSITKELLK